MSKGHELRDANYRLRLGEIQIKTHPSSLGQTALAGAQDREPRLTRALNRSELREVEHASFGMSSVEAAKINNLSPKTVKGLRTNATAKKVASNMSETILISFLEKELDFSPDDEVLLLPPSEALLADYICCGMTDEQMCKATGWSLGTLRDHLKSLYSILGINSRTQIPRRMFETGAYVLPDINQ